MVRSLALTTVMLNSGLISGRFQKLLNLKSLNVSGDTTEIDIIDQHKHITATNLCVSLSSIEVVILLIYDEEEVTSGSYSSDTLIRTDSKATVSFQVLHLSTSSCWWTLNLFYLSQHNHNRFFVLQATLLPTYLIITGATGNSWIYFL